MPDYGLPLQFGTFITPTNRPADAAVQRALLSEQLGFDLVTFQDHPYQPSFHDTWTLMTWVAAQTTTIHIAPNVLNVPLRPPAVTARAAASLDLLSGGRFELALGAGGFWDAIEAMGGRRLTPGQAVSALGEAIDVIRGIWATDDRAPLRIPGEYYRLDGAKRGPVPAHDIPLWIGAAKPRMLGLTGRKGDGWLPSLMWMKPENMADANAIIDEAATDAGRNPAEIRRLLNIGGTFATSRGGLLSGPPQQWVEELTTIALEHGFSTYILATDDPTAMQIFAQEVVPALRDAVLAERGASGVKTATPRRASALALRRPKIDYDGLPDSLRSIAIEPGDLGYGRVKSTYMRGGTPGLVLRLHTNDQVREALAFARNQDVPLAVRSGGHGISGRSTNDGGIVLDVGPMNEIVVLDEASRRVRIGPGATWMEVAAALEPHGWALSSGDYGGVGVGGLATAGGVGYLGRKHGLTIDHLQAAEVVLANGRVVRASDDENPDLFWALRGAGANFGIVTAFEFEVGEVGWAQLAFDASDTAEFLVRWGAAVEAAPRELTSFLIIGSSGAGQQTIAHTLTVVDSNDPDTIMSMLQPFAQIAPLVQQSVQLVPYASIMANASGADHDGRGEPVAGSGLIEHLTPEFAEVAASLLAGRESYFFSIRSVGGAVSDVPPDATAYAHRSANFSLAVIGANQARFSAAWDALRPYFTGLYLSFETDLRTERISDAFPPKTLARLTQLKHLWDPDNVFRDNFNITQPPA
jgi:hypothetical protein